MLRQKARLIARVVYLVDLGLTSLAFFIAFFLRDLVLPHLAPAYFPTGLFPIQEYLKIYPIVLVIWSALLFTYHSYHSHRTIPLTKEVTTILRIVVVGNVLLATLAFLSYLVTELGPLMKWPDWVLKLSVFSLYGTPLTSGVYWTGMWILLAVVILGFGVAAVLMQRREVGR